VPEEVLLSRSGQDFRLRRRGVFTDFARHVVNGLLKYHRVVIEGAENLPLEGPALLLPKHRAYRDILIEGIVLHRVTGRYASYVMKAGLFGVLGLLGGVKIVRPKDLRRLKDKQERRRRLEDARRRNLVTLDYLDWLYRQGEIVVSHPEGMRCKEELGPLQKEIVEAVMRTERQAGLRVPLIPVGLQYDSYRRPGGRVYFRIGEPLFTDQFDDVTAIMQVVSRQLEVLSGLTAND
jgi:1-acyl-sn-glycerol-3-phosphate acyltransferase